MTVPNIGFDEIDQHLTWADVTNAIETGHKLPRADIADSFLYRRADTVLTRSAWIDGLGVAVKAATVFPENRTDPVINGGVMLMDDTNGRLQAILDFHLLTKWKTAGDSLFAAQKLAPKIVKKILIIGTGTVARNMISAYSSHFNDAEFVIWGRSSEKAAALGVGVADDLASAVRDADVICTATMSKEPVLKGEWLRAGQHLDLIGAYRPDMREVDDIALQRASIFVDSRATTIGHIGEIEDPLRRDVIRPDDIRADYYDLTGGLFERQSDDEITLCKNGGGAHLDLMVARAIFDKWKTLQE